MTDDSRVFRIALAGCGRISRNHIDAIGRVDGLRIVAACDPDADRAAAVGEELGVPWFTEYERMLAAGLADVLAQRDDAVGSPAFAGLVGELGDILMVEFEVEIAAFGDCAASALRIASASEVTAAAYRRLLL